MSKQYAKNNFIIHKVLIVDFHFLKLKLQEQNNFQLFLNPIQTIIKQFTWTDKSNSVNKKYKVNNIWGMCIL